MPAPATSDELLDLVRKTDVVEPQVLDDYLQKLRAAGPIPPEPRNLAGLLIRDGILTNFQAGLFVLGRATGFTIGKYRILERLGTGGMGSVFLCEDKNLRRRVAVKVLPPRIAKDPASLARFHREAQIVGVLDHPNIVHAHDFCQEDNLYYLVMEFIDGASLQEIVDKRGPLDVERAAHYIRQAAEGLQHAHENGLVHRDIKPGNMLVERTGTIKILDLGLARFTDDRCEAITTNFNDNSIMGTADYLAPEQAMSLHDVDIRADIYSLGMTFYFLLAGHPPFKDGTVPQKLLSHQLRHPTPIRELRPEVPEELAAVLARMIAKEPELRQQTPSELAESLAPWTQTAVPAPPEIEVRRLSPAALGIGPPTGPLSNGPATMRASSWILPEGMTGLLGTRPPLARVNADTPNPAAQQTDLELKPVEDEEKTKNDKNGKSPSGIRERLPDTSAGQTAATKAPPDEDVEVVDEDAPSLTDSGIRRGLKKRLGGSSSTTLSLRKRRKKSSTAGTADWRVWLAIGGGGVVVLAGLVGLIVWLGSRPSNRPSPLDSSNNSRVNATREPGKLFVSSSGLANTFPTLHAAMEQSMPGDHIVIQVESLDEPLRIQGEAGRGKGVTIESGLGSNKRVTWKPPVNHPEGQPLVDLTQVSGLTLRGFRFDGLKRVHNLIAVTGHCPGLLLDDLVCDNFKKSAVKLDRSSGAANQPVSLREIHATARDKDVEAAVLLTAPVDQLSQHVRVQDCRFVGVPGPCKSAVQIVGPATDIVLDRNRIFRTGDGVLCKKGEPAPRLQLTLMHNTFSNLERGLHLETLPSADKGSRLTIQNNLFLNTKKMTQTDGVDTQPVKFPQAMQLIWSNEAQPNVPAEPRHFRKVFEVNGVVNWASLNVSADDSFIVWINGEEVGKGPHPFYTRHVYNYNITKKLKQGENVLAIQAANVTDFTGKAANAALLIHLTYNVGGKTLPLYSDTSWMVSATAPPNWQKPKFDDKSWARAKVLGTYNGKETVPWNHMVWDSTLSTFFQNKKLTPPQVTVSGNVRDYASAEGYPVLDARSGDVKLPLELAKDAQFLRYDKANPLIKVGAPGASPK